MHTLQTLVLTLGLTAAAATRLNVTAINAYHGVSVFECWQLYGPFSVSTQPGLQGSTMLQLGDVSNITYNVVSAGLDGGWHNAPHPQWVFAMAGSAYITVPGSSQGLYITGGAFGILFAADTADISKNGHRSQYVGVDDTVVIQVPTSDGKIPEHTILHYGICHPEQLVGLGGLESILQ
ncbi:hypothetical protein GQ53DRAFT_728421 [Thozetella sp. PMI_491]|nr:hypothetical protein GQ53DRAFT_728421 [Thozetella sp. PMI_491]